MEISFNETKLYKYHPELWSYVIMSLISVAFLISDWAILYSSFGDFLLAAAIVLIFLFRKIHIEKKQMILLIMTFGIAALSFILSYLYNDYWFSLQRALLSTVKLIFYSVSLVIFYNYIKRNQLSVPFLKLNNILAVITVLVGIIITLYIYLDNFDLPHFVWTFTRQDSRSYFFAGNDAIVRTRSLFSEPAHLGYYLNIVFFSNVIYREIKTKKTVLFILIVGILLTLSYSMILIFIISWIILMINKIINGTFSWSYWYFVPIVFLGALIYYFWDFIDVAIIERTKSIISGEDGSANIRLLGSWMYVERDRLLMGNGIGHTPPVTNIYAYILSDFGLIGFIPYLGLTLYVILYSWPSSMFFIMMNMAKGGYLNPAFWLFLLFIFLYGLSAKQKQKLS